MTADEYRQYWAALTGKRPAEIYVPKALRDNEGDVDGSTAH